MLVPKWVVAAMFAVVFALLVVVLLAVAGRYDLVADAQTIKAWRIDRLTGTVFFCRAGAAKKCIRLAVPRPTGLVLSSNHEHIAASKPWLSSDRDLPWNSRVSNRLRHRNFFRVGNGGD